MTPVQVDLTTQEGVVAMMESSLDRAGWNANCNAVKEANGGHYPPFWFEAIIASGLLDRVAAAWGSSSAITISFID